MAINHVPQIDLSKKFNEECARVLKEIEETRVHLLNEFAKAYLAETGLLPSDVMLCTQFDEKSMSYRFWFEKKVDLSP